MTLPCLTGFMISRRNLELEGPGHPVQLPLPFHLGPAAPSFWHLSYSEGSEGAAMILSDPATEAGKLQKTSGYNDVAQCSLLTFVPPKLLKS